MLHKVRKMDKNRSIPWHFTLSDDDYITTSEDNNSSECINTHTEFLQFYSSLSFISIFTFIFSSVTFKK